MANRFKTPLALISYPHLAEAQKQKDASKTPKFGAAFVFTPDILAMPAEKTLFTAMQAEALEVVKAKWPAKYEQYLQSEGFKKGFRKDPKDGYPEGSIYINARSNNQPGMVYSILDPATGKPARVKQEDVKKVFYPGAIVRGLVSIYAFDTDGNRGVTFGLEGLQFVKDAPRIDNRVNAEDAFEADLSQKPASLDDLI